MRCIFVSDLHGDTDRYRKLFEVVEKVHPEAVFLGGDLFPGVYGLKKVIKNFLKNYMFSQILELNKKGISPRYFVILGNDDPRMFENILIEANNEGIIDYVHNQVVLFNDVFVVGYSYTTPSPFQLKDWEKYDVSRYVDIGAISPEDGGRTYPVSKDEVRYSTIAEDLSQLFQDIDLKKTICLFHSPPYNSFLDYAALDGKQIDHVMVDVHVGSIAIQRFIREKQPLVTLHGHVHESTRLTGQWQQRIGKTFAFSAAHDGPELAVVRFDTKNLDDAQRTLE